MTPYQEYKSYAAIFSDRYNIELPLALAVIRGESEFIPQPKPRKIWDGSYVHGVMQIKLNTARLVGYRGPVQKDKDGVEYSNELAEPEQSIHYGLKHFYNLLKKYGIMQDAIAAYISGYVKKNKAGRYLNKKGNVSKQINTHVNRVMGYYREYTTKLATNKFFFGFLIAGLTYGIMSAIWGKEKI